MSSAEFKEMCRSLKVFPVVVSEETIDKVTVFCANKQRKNPKGEESQTITYDANTNDATAQGSFEFGDFIRAFKVIILSQRHLSASKVCLSAEPASSTTILADRQKSFTNSTLFISTP